MLLGRAERDRDSGTYIATLFFTLSFLPLWPIRRYLVADGEGGSWYFLAGVPLSQGNRWWRGVVLAGSAVVALSIGLQFWHRASHDDVRFLNGLDFPVTVSVGDLTVPIPAGGRATRELRSGSHHLIARLDNGTVIEERDVRVPGGADVVVYNVLGAAPLYLEKVIYTRDGLNPVRGSEDDQSVLLAGSSWVTHQEVDDVFVPSKDTVRMPARMKKLTRTRVDVAEGGWRATTNYLASNEQIQLAAQIAIRVAMLAPEDEATLGLAYGYSMSCNDLEATRSFVARLIAQAPGSVAAHRLYQGYHERHGSVDKLRGRYKRAYDEQPGSADATYLYARIAPVAEAEGILEKAILAHPGNRWLCRALGWCYYESGRFVEALPHFQRLLQLAPELRGVFLGPQTHALVATDRYAEARHSLKKLFESEPARIRKGESPLQSGELIELIALYQRLLRSEPNGVRYATIRRYLKACLAEEPTDFLLAYVAALANDEPAYDRAAQGQAAEGIALARLTMLAWNDPAAAAELVPSVSEVVVANLRDDARLAIVCELFRAGKTDRAAVLRMGLSYQLLQDLPMELIAQLPAVGALPHDLEPSVRAVLLRAAARREDDESRRTSLLARARHFDPMGIVVPK